MANTNFKSKKLLVLSLVLFVTLLAMCFTVLASAEDNSDAVWTFTSDSVKDPMYIQEHFTKLPRAYEAEIYLPAGSYSNSMPIIANYPNSNSRDAFGFQLSSAGKPEMYYYVTDYDAANSSSIINTTKVTFNYTVKDQGWVRIAVVNETESGASVYKLYVNGELKETNTSYPEICVIDPVYSQYTTRELSIGNDGKNHFRGQIRNVAVYENALTAAEAANSAKVNMQNGDKNLMAYYDATMSGNTDRLFKDQTGNGHDAAKAFFERVDAKDYAYSFAFIGDTQFLVEKDVNEGTTKYASPIYDWIIANKDEKNIQHVFGLGDITDNNSDAEWEYAVTLHNKLGAAGVNYSVIPGNHDDYTTPAAKYNKYFGQVSSFVDSIDGYYQEGKLENFYTKFDVGEHKYMVIGLLYGAKDDVLEWANDVVAANFDREVIVITHSLFDAEGNWALRDTRYQTTTSRKDLNNGSEIWDKFISQHENITMAVAGHITGDIIKAGKSVGVNGNVVNTFLINPQGFDMATGYDTGMVAMFYFSEDGSEVRVENVSTIKTLREQASNPNSGDILFHEKNCFTFKIDEVESSATVTDYGALPNEVIASNNFAVFTDGAFVSAHATWKAATQAVADIFAADKTKDVAILLLKDYTNTDDGVTNLALYANSSLTIDLWKHTFTRVKDFLNLNSSSDLANTAASNITVKNGTVRSQAGSPLIANQINNKAYTAEKVWNITFEGVTIGYGESVESSNGLFYQAWTNSATADESQLGTKTNIVFNNCTIDLKTNAPTTAIPLFTLKDNRSLDKIDVNVTINGGTILSDADNLKNVTFYTLNSGSDSFIFGADSKGNYTKLKTNSTAVDYAHYSVAMPTANGNRYFVEVSDNGTESVYELQSLSMTYTLLNGTTKTGTISLGTENADAKYLSAVDYPFVLFDQTGKFYSGRKTLLSDAINSAIYHIVNTSSKPSGKTAYVLMRSDYTMTSAEKHDNLSHGRESGIVIDMRGHSIIADSTRSADIFNLTIKQWTGSADDIYSFATRYYIRNGTFKTHTARVLYYKSSNGSDISNKLMGVTLDNVTFELLPGATVNRFFHIAGAAKTTSAYTSAPVELILNDCTFDFTKNVSSSSFSAIRCNFGADTAKTIGTVEINGGKVLANSLSKIEVLYYVEGNDFSLTFGPGSDGKYFSVVLPGSADASSVVGMKGKTESGVDVVFAKASGSTQITYTFCVETKYGYAPAEYADAQKYPFFVFKKDGTFVGAYAEWAIDATASALNNSKTAGSVVLLRRDFVYSKGQYNNLSQTYSVTIDLNGFELKTTNAALFMAQKKNEYETKVTVINGDIVVAGSRSVVRMDTGVNFSGKYGFVFEFTNVNFKLPETTPTTDNFICWSSYGDEDPAQYCNFTFNDCVFDLSNATKAFNIFDVSENRAHIQIVINGGEIITSDEAITLWKNYTDTPDNVTAYKDSTLTFAKGTNGYTKLTVPTGTALPIKSVNGGSLIYVKTAVGTTTDTYELISGAVKNYAPKMSITLANSFIMNVYIPVDCTEKFIFNGVTYENLDPNGENVVTLSDGNAYYLVTVALGSSEAAKDISLLANVVADDVNANVSFTFSISKYAAKLLADNDATETEQTLVMDVLAYVKEAYNYVGFAEDNSAEEIARVNALIDSIIGDYVGTLTESGANADNNGGVVTAVTLNLDATPSIRFYTTNTSLALYANGRKLDTVSGTDTNGTYVEIDASAYALAETITFGNGGSYHISSYVAGAGENEKALANAFLKYVESAAAYREQELAKA